MTQQLLLEDISQKFPITKTIKADRIEINKSSYNKHPIKNDLGYCCGHLKGIII